MKIVSNVEFKINKLLQNLKTRRIPCTRRKFHNFSCTAHHFKSVFFNKKYETLVFVVVHVTIGDKLAFEGTYGTRTTNCDSHQQKYFQNNINPEGRLFTRWLKNRIVAFHSQFQSFNSRTSQTNGKLKSFDSFYCSTIYFSTIVTSDNFSFYNNIVIYR
jgi:hypothetical protein